MNLNLIFYTLYCCIIAVLYFFAQLTLVSALLITALSALMVFRNKFSPQNPKTEVEIDPHATITNVADNITKATSKNAIGAAEVAFYVDSLAKEIDGCYSESESVNQATQALSHNSSELTNNITTVNQAMIQTAKSLDLCRSTPAIGHRANRLVIKLH
ncbi:hypothetical protein [Pseudoalteromonas sp. KAN5]|uniref:hypothetical protein n=1 Tax=Pseudoalteromonas sp. KAN5 TaxID=2916633 RepID=UPI001FCC1093|nr:hypothetical protein [Pseudoalteromonas sp. KAN5]BDF94356.1 hypothetical protein KAN5_11940 [Pseudoalteromonas sp. KAN5]